MEEPVLRVLQLQLLDGRGLAMRRHTDEMMPAENLMENDAVRKAAEPEAEDDARPNQWMFGNHAHGVSLRSQRTPQSTNSLGGSTFAPTGAITGWSMCGSVWVARS